MRRLTALLLVLTIGASLGLFSAGCTRQVASPPPVAPNPTPSPGEPTVAEPKPVELTPVNYEGRRLYKVFGDFSGVSDLALVDGELRYVYANTLWKTRLEDEHAPVQGRLADSYEKWYTSVSTEHQQNRARGSSAPSKLFRDLATHHGRYHDRHYMLAFSPSQNRTELRLADPGGEVRTLLQGLKDLTILGWRNNAILVLYADVPGQGPNVYILDVWSDYTAMRGSFNNSISMELPIVVDVLAGRSGVMWRYDDNRLAYTMGNRVYLLDGSGVHRQHASSGLPVAWARQHLIIFAESSTDVPQFRFGNNQMELKPLHWPIIAEVDWENQQFYYAFKDGSDIGLAVVDLGSQETRELFYVAEDHQLSTIVLSPSGEELIFIQARALPEDGPYSRYQNEVYRYDILSGNMLQLTGSGIEDIQGFIDAAYWVRQDTLLLGWGSWHDHWITEFSLSEAGEVPKAQAWNLNLLLADENGKNFFLANWSPGDGIWEYMDVSLWHYSSEEGGRPRQLTRKESWQTDVNWPQAYSPNHQWLYVSRHKGYANSDYTGEINHGVLINASGKEFTLFVEGLTGREKAVWVGDSLYLQAPDRIWRFVFD